MPGESPRFDLYDGPREFLISAKFDDCRKFRDATGAHKQRGRPEQKSIARGQIQSTLPGSISVFSG